MDRWYAAKRFLEQSTEISMDALHVLIGAIAFLLLALLVRRPVTSWLPWLLVLLIVLVNEAGDLWAEQWPSLAIQYGEAAKDLLITMLLPTVTLLSARYLPSLYRAPPRKARRGSGTRG